MGQRTGLDVGSSIHLSDLALPAGAEAVSHGENETIATIVAPSAGRHVVEVDTVATLPEQASDALFVALAERQATWRRVPLTPSRLALSTTGHTGAGLAVYQPRSLRARVCAAVARRGIPLLSRRVASPMAHLDELWLGSKPAQQVLDEAGAEIGPMLTGRYPSA